MRFSRKRLIAIGALVMLAGMAATGRNRGKFPQP